MRGSLAVKNQSFYSLLPLVRCFTLLVDFFSQRFYCDFKPGFPFTCLQVEGHCFCFPPCTEMGERMVFCEGYAVRLLRYQHLQRGKYWPPCLFFEDEKFVYKVSLGSVADRFFSFLRGNPYNFNHYSHLSFTQQIFS